MSIRSCHKCGSQFSTSNSSTTCSACINTEKRIESERIEGRINRDHESYLERQRQRIDEEARQEELDANERNARLIAESNTSYADAETFGRNYLKTNHRRNNIANLQIIIDEGGKVSYSWIPPFSLDHLNQAFAIGINDALRNLPQSSSKAYMLANAYNAGNRLMENFYIPCENDADWGIKSNEFNSTLKRIVNEQTGEIYYQISTLPFKSNEMNKEYQRGIKDGIVRENSQEKCTERLSNEVPRIQAQRFQKERKVKKRYLFDILLKLSVACFILLFLFMSGWGLRWGADTLTISGVIAITAGISFIMLFIEGLRFFSVGLFLFVACYSLILHTDFATNLLSGKNPFHVVTTSLKVHPLPQMKDVSAPKSPVISTLIENIPDISASADSVSNDSLSGATVDSLASIATPDVDTSRNILIFKGLIDSKPITMMLLVDNQEIKGTWQYDTTDVLNNVTGHVNFFGILRLKDESGIEFHGGFDSSSKYSGDWQINGGKEKGNFSVERQKKVAL